MWRMTDIERYIQGEHFIVVIKSIWSLVAPNWDISNKVDHIYKESTLQTTVQEELTLESLEKISTARRCPIALEQP